MEIGLPSGSPELWRHCWGCSCRRCAAGLLRTSFILSLHSGRHFSPLLLGWSCMPLPTSTDPSHPTGLDKKQPQKNKGVNYHTHLEISLPGTKKQIPALSGFWMGLNIQSTTAEIRWCFCSICRKHTGSDAADIKITVLFRKSDSVSFQATKCYLKHKETGKKKKKSKYCRNEEKYPELKAKLTNFKLVSVRVKQQF